MIVSRTPFRITLGGGGTDLPSYYENHGGFIFSFSLSKYMYVCINRPSVDELIRLKYSISETVKSVNDLNHDIAKACLDRVGVSSKIEIASLSDTKTSLCSEPFIAMALNPIPNSKDTIVISCFLDASSYRILFRFLITFSKKTFLLLICSRILEKITTSHFICF